MFQNVKLIFALLFTSIFFLACKSTTTDNNAAVAGSDSTETYFSIRQFLNNQWTLLKVEPIVFLKIVEEDGKIDSTYVPLDSALFESISAPFIAGDISNPEFVGKYKYSASEDRSMDMIFLQYDALDETLICRNLLISASAESGRIATVYMETQHSSFWSTTIHKMTFTKTDAIVIREFSKSFMMSPDEKITSYLQRY